MYFFMLFCVNLLKSRVVNIFEFIHFFQPYIQEIFSHLRGEPFRKFLERYENIKNFDTLLKILIVICYLSKDLVGLWRESS